MKNSPFISVGKRSMRGALNSVSAVALLAALSATVEAADCSTSDSSSAEYFCTGDVLETDIDATDLDDDISEIIFDDINSSEYDGTYVFWVDNTGDEGNSHGDDGDDVNGILVYYDGTDSDIKVSGGDDTPVMSYTGAGGNGHSGKDRTSSTSSGNGGNGGDGGTLTGSQALTFVEGTVSGDGFTAVEVTASGGNGGSGGHGKNYATITDGTGGDGGNGGDGATAELTIDLNASLNINVNGEDQAGIYVLSSGGDGNDGGKGEGGYAAYAGDGGYGGRAGDASFYQYEGSTLIIESDGELAHAVEVISRGGDGGDGGDATNSIGDAYGGDGGSGGTSGTVTVEIDDATLKTLGEDSIGILARSYGGAGGDGGSGDTDVLDGVGGSSSGSGNSGDVSVTFGGTLTTSGSGDDSDDDGDDYTTTSTGILAQSVAGFSGDAGNGDGYFEGYGADSESAGSAGSVEVTINEGSTISTEGSYSSAIEAQSIGGGGGKAGSADGLTAIGGDGSAGGDGGKVTITVNGSTDDLTQISTLLDYSSGISAQSIGGGGGSGGGADGATALGGSGGTGGAGDDVKVTLYGDVSTTGETSEGVFAQSIGGGGGKAHSTSATFKSVGGSGGDGGDAGSVTFEHYLGDITTTQDYSDGVDLQSIGNGGGKATSSTTVGSDVSIAIGGSGGDGGDGGTVTYTDDGTDYTISTEGDYAAGISAQSAGGGGGNSGSATSVSASIGFGYSIGTTGDSGEGGDAGVVSVDTVADISTTGEQSDGIFAQSAGGGGGKAGSVTSASGGVDLVSITYSVGGDGGAGGNGDDVSVVSSGTITTTHDYSYGIFAQSSGGGGGKSSSTYSGTVDSVGAIDVSVGASGGSGGDAGAVTVENYGDITTGDEDGNGVGADAIYAQSSGGGGGNSGQTYALSGVSYGSFNLALGGDGGDGGSADDVEVINSGTITTYEDNSDGIFAQSSGGGGGNAKTTFTGSLVSEYGSIGIGIGGDSGDGSAAGLVNVLNEGDITVNGDNSYAIYAESAGGGGGSSKATVSIDGAQLAGIAFDLGGTGGEGATGETVYVYNGGTLKTGGENGSGIYASSRGGSGGNASTVVTSTGISSGSIDLGWGASGGDGGTAEAVSVYNQGEITTGGSIGHGILAQSIGGSGGNSSSIYELSLEASSSYSGGSSGGLTMALGTDGGYGGEAGEVNVENLSTITTTETLSDGIKAQSIGGSGGSAGTIVTVTLDAGTADTTAEFDIGGSGGGGSTSDVVTVTNDGDISTSGYKSRGIFAQSMGGSGGDGGSVTSVSGSYSTYGDIGINVGAGGEGGDGAVGNQVTVTNSGSITTDDMESHAIYAQSLGGDGGSGGTAITYSLDIDSAASDSSFALETAWAIGGNGGSGNDADAVSVTNNGELTVKTSNSRGIFAQSVGGGGGDGGSAEALAIAFGTSDITTGIGSDWSLGVEIGGSGGASGDGGTVYVENNAKITTDEDTSSAIFAQSVGGGGGTGGDAGSTDGSASTATEVIDGIVSVVTLAKFASNYKNYVTAWEVAVGGEAGASGDGDDVTVVNTNEINTGGDDSSAIYAQSVGGGGGTGGTASGSSITTSVEVGGTSGAGGHGGEVIVENSGDITTTGARANGIWAQSVGGGGGDAGDVEGAFWYLFNAADADFSMDIGVVVETDAGNGGDGKTVGVSSTDADITTTGESAVGIWAQSVGGGGGASGSAVLSIYIAGSDGSEGDSGDVIVDLENSNVSATGEYGMGLFAQSSSGAYQTDDDVSDLDGYFEYDGDDSYDSGDVQITLTDGASISTSGTDGMAVVAASTGYSNAGSISIGVDSDSSISGSNGNATVISLFDGNSNSIVNYGTIEDGDFTDTDREDDIYVIYADVTSDSYESYYDYGQGNVAISNYGTVSGSIYLYQPYFDSDAQSDYDGTLDFDGNIFANESGATFNMGSIVNLGSASGSGYDDLNSVLSNSGTLSPGGVDTIFTTTMTNGLLEANSDGTLLIDYDMSDGSDADLIVADEVSVLDGSLEVNVTDSTDVADGDTGSFYTLVTDTLDDDDPGLTAKDSAIVDYEVTILTDTDVTIGDTTYSDTNAVEVSYTVDVGSSGASVNTTELSSYLTSSDDSDDASASISLAQAALIVTSDDGVTQVSGLAAEDESAVTDEVKTAMNAIFTDMLNAETVEDLDALAVSHVLDEAGAAFQALRQTSYNLHNDLRQCEGLSQSNRGGFLRDRDCAWVGLVGGRGNFENGEGGSSFDERSYGLSAGGQRVLDNGLIFGGMIRGEDVSLSGTGVDQDGHRFTFGAMLTHEAGPMTFSLSAGYGYQGLSQTRSYSVSGTAFTANSDIVSHVYSADARMTFLQEFDRNYLRWGVGLGVYHTQQDGFDESGDGVMNWAMQGSNETDVILRPSVEFGQTFAQGRVYLNAGLAANLTDPETTIQGTVIGSGLSPMSHVFSYDRIVGEIGVGLDYELKNNMRLSIQGNGIFSENVSSGDVSARLQWLF